MTKREPIFNVPGGVLATLAVLIAVHVALSLLSPLEYEWWVLALAFIPARYAGFASQLPGGDTASITSLILRSLVWSTALENSVQKARITARQSARPV